MKIILASILTIAIAGLSSAEAITIKASGSSGKYLYTILKERSRGIETAQAKSLMGSKVEIVKLYNLLQCGLKHGWLMQSYSCQVLDTQYEDIIGANMISLGGDINDAMEELNRQVNRNSVASFRGLSAKIVYERLAKLTEDNTYYQRSGKTKFLKRDFEGYGIDEVYCQKVNGLLGVQYTCLLPNIRTSDLNAPVVVLNPPDKKKN